MFSLTLDKTVNTTAYVRTYAHTTEDKVAITVAQQPATEQSGPENNCVTYLNQFL